MKQKESAGIARQKKAKFRPGAWYAKHYKSWPLLFLMALLLCGVIVGLGHTRLLENLEEGSMDLLFRLCPQPAKADTSIVMVAIDDASLKYARQILNQGWPWPRDFYAVITDFLAEEGAKATIFDISFDEPDLDRGGLDAEESDARFAQALQESQNAILAVTFTHYQTPSQGLIHPLPYPKGFSKKELKVWPGALAPYQPFSDAANLGGINLASGIDATIRRTPLIYPYQDGYIPSLALRAYSLNHDPEPVLRRIQTPDATMCLNWHGPAGPENGVFRYIPFSQLLESAVAQQNGFEPPIPVGWFKNRYVFIGAVASGLQDLKSSPYTWGTPGIEVWATQLSNLLGQNFIRFIPPWGSLVLVFVLSFLMLVFVMRLRGSLASLMGLLLLVLFCGASIYLFDSYRIALGLSRGLATIILSWMIGLSIGYTLEGRHKRELRRIFNRYLHPEVVDEITNDPDSIALGGTRHNITVLFTDIYSFTNHTEDYKDKPRELVQALNDYFGILASAILDHRGFLDKYTGDGLMAVFGIPERKDNRINHALQACLAALNYRGLRPIKDRESASLSELFHLDTRIGISTGDATCGNLGSERRMDYTSIGDCVNLSARLESLNKEFRTNIIISGDTYAIVKEKLYCRKLDTLCVKGKKDPTDVYELIAELDKIDSQDYLWHQDYQKAFELYQNQKFSEAAAIFEKLSKEPICDPASISMKKRCAYLIENPPLQDWDGVFTATTK